jgi:hypothetical protein
MVPSCKHVSPAEDVEGGKGGGAPQQDESALGISEGTFAVRKYQVLGKKET